jgi:carbamoyltransferase
MSSLVESLPEVNKVFIQPAANDGGISLGAAIYGSISMGDKVNFEMIPYTGDEFTDDQIIAALKDKNYEYEYYDDIERKLALLLSEDKLIGNFQGRMEFGPRALGNRSILSSPIHKETWEKINNLKGREVWRPLAPAVLYDKQTEFFDSNVFSPYMTKNFNVIDKMKEKIPVATHVDGTARVQSVTKEYNNRFYDIINEFYKITGVPVLINTSFNVRGEPIVNTPLEAINSFEKIGLDYLALKNYLIKRKK